MAVAAAGAFMAANAGAIASATMAGAAIMQGVQQRQAAERQQQYQKQQNELALQSMRDQYGQLNQAESDARNRGAMASMDNQTEAARRKARINLMAAASGTQGLSIDSMMQDISREQGRNLNTINRNQEIELQGFRNQAEAIRTGTAGRIDNRKIQRPSWAEIGINTASSATQGYLTGQSMSAQLGNTGNPRATLGQPQGYNTTWTNEIAGGV